MKFKIIQEYDRFYLAVNDKGFRECFNKAEYYPTEDGYIIKRSDKKHEMQFYKAEEE